MTTSAAVVRPFPRRFPSPDNSILSERVALMCASALFSCISPTDCLEIASWARMRVYARDEALFMQGQASQGLMLIQAGSAKLTQLSSGGSEVILWMSGHGEAIGIFADPMNNSSVHSCSARALERCSTLTWDHSRINMMLEQYPRIRTNMTHILSSRLEELEERFREIATERVAKRLAFALLRLTKQVGRPHNSGTLVSISREELGQLIGTTLFTISRILSKWNETGLVLARREAVVVCDARHLQSQAELE